VTEATDVHRTITYAPARVIWARFFIGVALAATGLLLIYDGPPDTRMAGWIMLPCGIAWCLYHLVQSLFPGKLVLELSPKGIRFPIEGVKQVFIPWDQVHHVETVDIRGQVLAGEGDIEFPKTTVVLVKGTFYDDAIHVESALLRGPIWSSMFIPRGAMMQVALFHQALGVDSRELRKAVETRWRAFGGKRDEPQTRTTS
jgi:hypothetical protein